MHPFRSLVFLLAAGCAGNGLAAVSASAPDSLPAWVHADSSISLDGFTKRVILVVFEAGATRKERTLAARTARATVIGGVKDPLGMEGFYFLRLDDPAGIANPDSVVDLLNAFPFIESAARDYRATGAFAK